MSMEADCFFVYSGVPVVPPVGKLVPGTKVPGTVPGTG